MRASAKGGLPALGFVVLQLVVFPMPLGAWLRGVVVGLLLALLALGLALVYRSNRIINFAQADLGFVPCSLVVGLVVFWQWPWALGLGVGVVCAAVLGVSVEFLLVRRFRASSRLVLTVATIGITQLLAVVAVLVPRWWGRSAASQRLPTPVSWRWEIGSFTLNANDLAAMVLAPAAMVGVVWFLDRTLVGTAVRATAQRADRAAMLGIPTGRLSAVVWGVAAVLSFLAAFLRAGILGVPLGSALSITTLVGALAALVIGRLSHLPTIVASAVGLGVLEYGITWNQDTPALTAPIMAAVIVVALAAQRRSTARSEPEAVTSWRAVEEPQPLPAALAKRPGVRVLGLVTALCGAAVLLALPSVLRVDQLIKVNAMVIFAVVGISLVVLTGWAGQVSLGHMAFVGLGAASSGWLTITWSTDLSLAIAGAGAVGALAAVVVGLPALRLQGLYLAVTTLVFALVVSAWLVNPRFFSWVPTQRLERRPLFGRIDMTSPTRYYLYTVVVAALVAVAVVRIRASRNGRTILALRENERCIQTFAVHPTRVKLRAFVISGTIAGVAGGLLAHLSQAFDPATYGVVGGLEVFSSTVVGGAGSLGGAVLGALYLRGTQWFVTAPEWRLLIASIGLLSVLLLFPGGLVRALTGLRNDLVQRLFEPRAPRGGNGP